MEKKDKNTSNKAQSKTGEGAIDALICTPEMHAKIDAAKADL